MRVSRLDATAPKHTRPEITSSTCLCHPELFTQRSRGAWQSACYVRAMLKSAVAGSKQTLPREKLGATRKFPSGDIRAVALIRKDTTLHHSRQQPAFVKYPHTMFVWQGLILGASRCDEAEGTAYLWVCRLTFPTSCVLTLFVVPRGCALVLLSSGRGGAKGADSVDLSACSTAPL